MANNDSGNDNKKPPKVKLELWDADEVKEIAEKLIPKYHSELVDARIKYLFRSVAKKHGERITLGTCSKISGRQEHLTNLDFVIEIAYDSWTQLSPTQRTALVDHELCHAKGLEDDKTGEMKWSTVPHDVEEFREIINRHGLWGPDLELLAQSIEEAREKEKVKNKAETKKRDAPENNGSAGD